MYRAISDKVGRRGHTSLLTSARQKGEGFNEQKSRKACNSTSSFTVRSRSVFPDERPPRCRIRNRTFNWTRASSARIFSRGKSSLGRVARWADFYRVRTLSVHTRERLCIESDLHTPSGPSTSHKYLLSLPKAIYGYTRARQIH